MRVPKIRTTNTEQAAQRASSVLENAEVRKGFDDARNALIADIESASLDTPEDRDTALERIRQLQALLTVKRVLVRPLAVEMVRQKAVGTKKPKT